MIARTNRLFGLELLPRALFAAPPIAKLSITVTQALAEVEPGTDEMLAKVEQMQGRSALQGPTEGR